MVVSRFVAAPIFTSAAGLETNVCGPSAVSDLEDGKFSAHFDSMNELVPTGTASDSDATLRQQSRLKARLRRSEIPRRTS